MKILVLNGGSSSLKAALFEITGPPPAAAPAALWNAHVDWEHEKPEDVFGPMLGDLGKVDAVGHRIVHGGRAFRDTTRITSEVRETIARMAAFAPEHNRLELEAIEAAERIIGAQTPQFAVFDTAFHATLDPVAYVYPGPWEWLEQGIRRYGFHGISHQYVSRRAAEILPAGSKSPRMVTCHLGNGCSLAAVRDGCSIDTTMGFTPLEGLMMGTRSGTVDPGILIHLVRHCGYAADRLDRLLNKESGLLGISGVSADMRSILSARAAGNERARLAFDLFVHRVAAGVGSMAVSLGGLDALVFTAGIGENSQEVRAAVCERLGFLGVELDAAAANASSASDRMISSAASPVKIVLVRTNEEWEIARECYRMHSR